MYLQIQALGILHRFRITTTQYQPMCIWWLEMNNLKYNLQECLMLQVQVHKMLGVLSICG
ncbi:hypothetical protein PROH_13165 [Prochlorothrix hollandica PCC 9006 = CALU 1027]|uniref:Uncharacterized protein n=1 Tax=Prochlorothrix hollandica PCC 9006 = CALU 1027 TaxID=317619 RepID=A0A0M2PWR1_PROHO|nr:hypothetical protein PROH_13165 [Prochlorothrix hollandica PCC 9006 = CALU 1027]